METIFIAVLTLVAGLWIGMRSADRKWRHNATEPYHLSYGNWLYKVQREKKPRGNTI